MEKQHRALQLATHFAPETKGGLLICGLNWGRKLSDGPSEVPVTGKSYFSDKRHEYYPFKQRLLIWFELWGHPLEPFDGNPGTFERSISHMNWWTDQSHDTKGIDYIEKCRKHREHFLYHLTQITPRLILFLGQPLLDALNRPWLFEDAQQCLGQACKPIVPWIHKEFDKNGKPLRPFKVRYQEFEQCEVIALPHPTGSRGLSNKYIAAFRPEIGPILSRYRLKLVSTTQHSP